MSSDQFLLEDCVAFMACRDSKRISDSVEQKLAPYDITRVQWNALYFINVHKDKTITQRELADSMGLREPTMVRLIDRMEKNGLLKREPSKIDRRRNNLVLTKKGREVNEKISGIIGKLKDDAVKDIPAEDIQTFKRVFKQIVENCING